MADITLSEEQLQSIVTQAVTQVTDTIIKKSSFDDSEKAVARTTFDSIIATIGWYNMNGAQSSKSLDSLLGVLGQALVELNRLYELYTEEEFQALTGGV